MRATSLRTTFIVGACIINVAIFLLSLRFAYASYEKMGYIIRGGVAGQTAEAAESIRMRLETLFNERLNDMKDLAARIREESSLELQMERFSKDARVLVQNEIVYHSIQFLDPSSIVRAHTPPDEKLDLVGFDMKTLPGFLESYTYVRETGKPYLSRPVMLTTGIPGVVLNYPVFLQQEEREGFIGIISALLLSDLVVVQVVRSDDSPKYVTEIRLADQTLYSSKTLVEDPGTLDLEGFIWSTGARRRFSILGCLWEVRLELRNVTGYKAILDGNRKSLYVQVVLYFLVTLFLCTAIWALAWTQESRRKLIFSEERLDLAIQGAGLGLWDWDLRTGEININRRLTEMLGYDLNELSPSVDTWQRLVHPDDRDESWNRLLRHLRMMDPQFETEQRLRAKDGKWIWVLSKGRVVERDEEGNPIRAAGTHLDISERRQMEANLRESLQEKEVLLQEVNHRVKNNLQILISLLNLEREGQQDKAVAGVMDEWRNRVHAMSLIHEKLHLEGGAEYIDANDYLRSLAEWAFVSFNMTDRISINIQVNDLRLHLDTAIPLGLILNELVSNSLKYAFPDGQKGTIWITLSELPQQMLRLVVRDNGVGPPQDFDLQTSNRLGFILVQSLAAQLKGAVQTEIPEGGGFLVSLDFYRGRFEIKSEVL